MRDRRQSSGCELVEVRFALLVERCDTFLRLRRVVEQLHGMNGKVADAPDIVRIGIEGTLGERNRGWRPWRQLVGPFLRSGFQLCSRNHLVDQPHLARLFSGVAFVQVPDLPRFLVADVAREEGRAPAGIDGSDLWPNLTELRGVHSDRKVAERREHIAAADGKAVDARNHRLRNVPNQTLQFVNRQPHYAAAVILPLMRGLIASRAESLVSRAGQDDARGLPIVGGEMQSLAPLL